jgi:hypothetical protein
MSSGAGNAPGFQKRGDAVAGHYHNKRDDDRQLSRSKRGRPAYDVEDTAPRNYQENKAQNLMPQRMRGLHSGGKNVLYKLAGLAYQMLVGHDSIVSGA